MVQFCIFGGQGGVVRPDRPRIYCTLFGGCDLRLAPMATLAAALRNNRSRGMPFFFTAFGATEVKRPTLVDEFIDLQEHLRAGTLHPRTWEADMREAAEQVGHYGSFTIFGGLETSELPSENEELDRMALSYSLGQIGEMSRRLLMTAIGQNGTQRAAAICQAVTVAGEERPALHAMAR